MGILSWWSSISQRNDAADMIIESGNTDISTENLYAMAERASIRDADTFVTVVNQNLDEYDEDMYVKEHETLWQKFCKGVWP